MEPGQTNQTGAHQPTNISLSVGALNVRHMSKSALLVWGGWHGHAPKECAEIFGLWLEEQNYQVDVSETLDAYRDTNYLKSFDLIVPIWTQGELPRLHTGSLLEAVYSGVGIAGWHGSMGDSFRTNVDYQFLVGGQWVAHPGGLVEYEVNIKDRDDQITDGLDDFRIVSEQYYMHVDPSNEVLATTTFTGSETISTAAPYACSWIANCVMPVVWKRRWGKGRVFFSSLGHQPHDFDIPEVMTMTCRGLLWASR